MLIVHIVDEEYRYSIDHASKTVFQMPLQTGQNMVDTMIEEEDVDPAAMRSGKRETDGKTYDTEEWSSDDATSILCSDGDDLAYMIVAADDGEMVTKVIRTDNQVDDSLFEIPADYQVMSY